MKSVAIIGGSYNPIHNGHLNIADETYEKLGVDEVWLWVSQNIFKDPSIYAPLDDRMTMSGMMVGNRHWLKAVDIEKNFADSMTATSLTTLAAIYPDTNFTWVFGDDNFSSFHTWNREKFKQQENVIPDWQYIMNQFSVAVMHRPGYREDAKNSPAAAYGHGQKMYHADPSALAQANSGWSFVDNKLMKISSTSIKEALDTRQRNIQGLNPEVEEYIYNQGLYGTGEVPNATQNFSVNTANESKDKFNAVMLLASATHLIKSIETGQFGNRNFFPYKRICGDATERPLNYTENDLAPLLQEVAGQLQKIQSALQVTGRLNPNQNLSITYNVQNDIRDMLWELTKNIGHVCAIENMSSNQADALMQLAIGASDMTHPQRSLFDTIKVIRNYADDIGVTDSFSLSCDVKSRPSMKGLMAG